MSARIARRFFQIGPVCLCSIAAAAPPEGANALIREIEREMQERGATSSSSLRAAVDHVGLLGKRVSFMIRVEGDRACPDCTRASSSSIIARAPVEQVETLIEQVPDDRRNLPYCHYDLNGRDVIFECDHCAAPKLFCVSSGRCERISDWQSCDTGDVIVTARSRLRRGNYTTRDLQKQLAKADREASRLRKAVYRDKDHNRRGSSSRMRVSNETHQAERRANSIRQRMGEYAREMAEIYDYSSLTLLVPKSLWERVRQGRSRSVRVVVDVLAYEVRTPDENAGICGALDRVIGRVVEAGTR